MGCPDFLIDCQENLAIAKSLVRQLESENAKLRALLAEIRSCSISHTSEGRYHEVQIPIALWNEILKGGA